MSGEKYPYDERSRALEQLGWVKRDIDALEKAFEKLQDGLLGEADLLRLENRLIERWSDSLDTWWQYKPQEIEKLIDKRIKIKAEQDEAVTKAMLAKKGLEIAPDGSIRSTVNPAWAWLKGNWIVVLIGAGVVAWMQPEWARSMFTFIVRLIT